MTFKEWATEWQIPPAACADYYQSLGTADQSDATATVATSEADVQQLVRLEASRVGARLWRNNVGAGVLENGSFVRWGLCNESEQMNKVVKSSDLVGIRPLLIGPQHVGTHVGQFVAREIKKPGWRYSGDARETAQLKFIELVNALGGDAAFANSEGTL